MIGNGISGQGTSHEEYMIIDGKVMERIPAPALQCQVARTMLKRSLSLEASMTCFSETWHRTCFCWRWMQLWLDRLDRLDLDFICGNVSHINAKGLVGSVQKKASKQQK